MSVIGAAVVLGIIVALLVKWKIVRPVAAVACVLFGLVLGATPVGGQVNRILTQIGTWAAGQIGAL